MGLVGSSVHLPINNCGQKEDMLNDMLEDNWHLPLKLGAGSIPPKVQAGKFEVLLGREDGCWGIVLPGITLCPLWDT